MFLVASGTGTIRDHVRLVKRVLLMTLGAGAVDTIEGEGAFVDAIVQDLKKRRWRSDIAARRLRLVTGIATIIQVTVRSGERASIEEFRRSLFLEQINRDEAAEQKEEADPKTRTLPGRPRMLVTDAIFVALRDLPLRSALFIHGASIAEERDERVPHRHEQKQKGERHMHQEPGVQPMLHARL